MACSARLAPPTETFEMIQMAPPAGSAKIEPGDVLIAMGERSDLKKLEDKVES